MHVTWTHAGRRKYYFSSAYSDSVLLVYWCIGVKLRGKYLKNKDKKFTPKAYTKNSGQRFGVRVGPVRRDGVTHRQLDGGIRVTV